MTTFLDDKVIEEKIEETKRPKEKRFDMQEALRIAGTLGEEDLAKQNKLLDKRLLEGYQRLSRLRKELSKMMLRFQAKIDQIKMHTRCPQLLATVVEVLDLKSISPITQGCSENADGLESSAIIVQMPDGNMHFVPNMGMAQCLGLKTGDLVALNRSSRVIVDKLPPIFDTRVRAMEVVGRINESYSDIGGLDKQIQEIKEAIVYPITRKRLFTEIGITPCKGVLLYGPPGTGKTMIARAVAAQVDCTFLKLSATCLVQMYIGEGAKILREAFRLAKMNAPTIIFIDELDAIGITRNTSEHAGTRDAQRTMIELLNQMDGFDSNEDVKVIAATNRLDMLDPALLRSGRFDRKVEIPLPSESGRVAIMKVHARKLQLDQNVDFEEIARSTADFSGAQCRAVVIEAAMIGLRKGHKYVRHDDFTEAITEVLAMKKRAKATHYV